MSSESSENLSEDQFRSLKQSNSTHTERCADDLKILKLSVPIRLMSEANLLRQHWSKRHKRKKDTQRAILYMLGRHEKPRLPCSVHLTRIAPRRLDADNLAFCLKSSIDCIADWLVPGLQPGFADSDKRLKFSWDQKKGEPKEYGLEIKFEYR